MKRPWLPATSKIIAEAADRYAFLVKTLGMDGRPAR